MKCTYNQRHVYILVEQAVIFSFFLFIWRKEPFIDEKADVAIALSIVIMMVLFGIYICAGSGSSRRGGPSYSNIDKGKFGGQNNICKSTKLVFISKRLQEEKNGLKLYMF